MKKASVIIIIVNSTCPFCGEESEFTHLLIKQYKYWRINLHTSQYYLGRCAILLNRHLEDFFDISDEERNELFHITKQLREAVKKSFQTDMFNYATLGNIIPHVHLHFIPRYKNSVTFADTKFTDERWGKNYAPYNTDFKIPEDIYPKIKDAILNNLEK